MARRLKSIARWINQFLDGYTARIITGYCNTDRKIPGTRLRVEGKGRYGNRLIVTKDSTGETVLDHNAAETYRCNEEVESWLQKQIDRSEELKWKSEYKKAQKIWKRERDYLCSELRNTLQELQRAEMMLDELRRVGCDIPSKLSGEKTKR